MVRGLPHTPTSQLTSSRFDTHLPILTQQFSKPTNGGLTQDGHSDFFNFSTGRRGVLSLHTIFTLRPRHDLLQMAFQSLWGLQDLRYRPTDELELDFKLAPEAGGSSDYVFAIVSKDEMNTIRDNRWDLVCSISSSSGLYLNMFCRLSQRPPKTRACHQRSPS